MSAKNSAVINEHRAKIQLLDLKLRYLYQENHLMSEDYRDARKQLSRLECTRKLLLNALREKIPMEEDDSMPFLSGDEDLVTE